MPYAQVERIVLARRRTPEGREGLPLAAAASVAYFGAGGQTDVTLHLTAPLVLQGLRGATRPVRVIHVATDNPEGLAEALAHQCQITVARAPSISQSVRWQFATLASPYAPSAVR